MASNYDDKSGAREILNFQEFRIFQILFNKMKWNRKLFPWRQQLETSIKLTN